MEILPKMPPKSKNAFFYFALDFKNREESKGRKFRNGLKDVFTDEECSREWQEMPMHLRQRYNTMAKQEKNNGNGENSVEKKTCIGQSISGIKKKYEQETSYNETMYSYIESTISTAWARKTLATQDFIFVHANYFCVRELPYNTLDYYPAEFAVGKFSLKDGLREIYNEIINEKIPIGYKGIAMQNSQDTHQIPPEMEGGTDDFHSMGRRLKELLDINGTTFPPMFMTKKTKPVVQSLFHRMFPDYDDTVQPFLLYEIEALFQVLLDMMLRNAKQSVTVTALVAERMLQKDIFAYERGIECTYHRCIDAAVEYCSKSMIKRWSYTICDNICEGLDIDTIPGIHYPSKKSYENSYSVVNPNDDSTHEFANAFHEQCQPDKETITKKNYEVTESNKNLETSEKMPSKKTFQQPTPLLLTNGSATGRPLRLPKTTSRAQSALQNEGNSSNYNLNQSSGVGKGKQLIDSGLKKQLTALGRGWSNHSKPPL